MRILGLIPARSGSKGIPGKNTKILNGKPLVQYTVESALAATSLTKVILSTDDPQYMDLGKSLGVEVPFQRPRELAQDHTPTLPVIQHALQYLHEQGEQFDAVCLLQLTTPFRPKGFIDRAIKKFEAGAYDALVSVLPVPDSYNPHWVFEERNGELELATGDSEIIPRRQDLPPAYHRDGSLYLTRTEVLLEQNSLYGQRLGFLESDPEWYVNIDTPADWEKAERMAQKIED
ncbi:acylneuraminate cytidylyltransferase family protein [Croceiramulus getboli]|nr:acylneuraminate cytidylyltransferase family protein [Flavobacteriaceae bacterium YJPT1-3]